ncbi:MAG: LPS export ABC transporter permease LptG [Formivibrio sp.]|nr:LPS export ABC transporter permease LptG [Formivibrio sp.]
MKRLFRYIGAEIALYSSFTLLILISLFSFFDLLREVDDIGKGGYRFIDVVIYVLFAVPSHVYELLPIAVLIGGIYALSNLANNSELTVMRVSGVSMLRLTAWLTTLGMLFALLTVLLGEYVAPAASRAGSRYRIQATQQVLVGDTGSGIWIKDGKQIANISAMLPDMTLQGLRIYEFSNAQLIARIIDANTASFDEDKGTWQLSGDTVTTFPADQQKITVTHPPAFAWNTTINPDMLAVLMLQPADMSMQSLANYIRHLRENGQQTARYDLALWSKIFFPIACISMMLIALPFALLQRRSGNVGARIFLGILLGVGFNFLNRIMGHLGVLYELPPPLAAALPTFMLLAIAAIILWRQEK